MRDELLAYLLNDLDPQQRIRIEARLDSDPIWQHELDRLRSYVEEARQSSCGAARSLDETASHESGTDQTGPGETSADGKTIADSETNADGKTSTDNEDLLPADLVSRTCSFVRQASARGALSPAVLPASLTESQDTVGPTPKRWSLLDVVIVASLLLVLGTLLLPALRESRDAARRLQCQEKMHQLGTALVRYAERFGGELPRVEPHENVGIFIVQLADSGMHTRKTLGELVLCPGGQLAEGVFSGEIDFDVPTREKLATANASELRLMRARMSGDYAFCVGTRDQEGDYHYPRFVGSSSVPLLADAPSFSVVGFQSANHNGCGQNVMSQDLSIRYVIRCVRRGREDHLYLNAAGQHAAGRHKDDVVMLLSGVSPFGEMLGSSMAKMKPE